MQKSFYLLGIGGVSMSALAVMLKEKGFQVSGFDERESRTTKLLQENGIFVDFETNFDAINKADVVARSAAIKDDDPFVIYAKSQNKQIISRGQLLAQIAEDFDCVVAVAGSHGKTTTTAMIFEILSVAGLKPSLHLGGFRKENGQNFVLDGNEYFVTEACEYHDNFLWLHPDLSVITNVEKEHLDYFKTFENQKKSFTKFKAQSRVVVEGVGDCYAKNIRHDKFGRVHFDLFENNKFVFNLSLQLFEDVNVENCLYAYRAAKKLGIPDCAIKIALERFKGVERRFEKVSAKGFANVFVDYAHHPTEIKKAIETAKRLSKNKLLVTIFQPHTFSRTQLLLDEFVDVFSDVQLPVFFKTYSAREKESEGISAKEFTKILQTKNKFAQYFENIDDLTDFFDVFNKKKVVLLFLGAGDLPDILHKNKFIS